DQSDDAVDAVADFSAGQDEGDVEQFRDGFQPFQPLLAGERGERARAAELEMNTAKRRMQPFLRDLPPLLVDHLAARFRGAERRAGCAAGARVMKCLIVSHGCYMV